MTKNDKSFFKTIAVNKKARHDYFIEETFEAGIVLEGWEVKSIRASKVQLVDSYVVLKDGEAWLLGTHITPLTTTSTHVVADPVRTRKLLLNKKELSHLFGAVSQKGYTCIATAIKLKGRLIKCDIVLAKGKKDYDKRATEKDRDWNREKGRIMKENN
jgi:SsrA-binding protein